MLDDGLIVTSDVEMVRLVRGPAAAEVPDAPGIRPLGSCEVAFPNPIAYRGKPLYEAIVARKAQQGQERLGTVRRSPG